MGELLDRVFAGCFAPFERLGPAWALAAVSVLAGAVLLLLFRLLTPQEAVRRARARVLAELLAIRLFRDGPGATVRALGGLLAANGRYLRLALPALLVLCLPMVLVLVQLDLRYGRRPLRPGEETVVTVRFAGAVPPAGVALESGPGLAITAGPVVIPALGEASWRVRAEAAGRHEVRVRGGGEAVAKEVVAGEGLLPAAPARVAGGLVTALFHPGEPPLPARAGIGSIRVEYEPRHLAMLGVKVDWLVAFLVLSLLAAFLLRRPLGVAI